MTVCVDWGGMRVFRRWVGLGGPRGSILFRRPSHLDFALRAASRGRGLRTRALEGRRLGSGLHLSGVWVLVWFKSNVRYCNA
jgi:hypothetical protein